MTIKDSHIILDCLQKCRDLQARSILNIAKWLQADSNYLSEVSQCLSGTSDGSADGSADGTAGDEITDICNKIRTLISMEARSQLPTVHCSVDISAAPSTYGCWSFILDTVNIVEVYIDCDASKHHNYIFPNVQERQKNSSISLLILMCLVLTKCVFNRLLITRFV